MSITIPSIIEYSVISTILNKSVDVTSFSITEVGTGEHNGIVTHGQERNSSITDSQGSSIIKYNDSPYILTVNIPFISNTPIIYLENSQFVSITSESLPTGLSIDNTTGVISGTPTVAQSSTPYVVTIKTNYGLGFTSIKITILPAPTPSPTPAPAPPTPVPQYVCNNYCPTPVYSKPVTSFNGNTNMPTYLNTKAFRYSQLVSLPFRARGSGTVAFISNNKGVNACVQPPKNKF